MDQFEQADAFRFDLQALLNRYLQEFDMPVETLIGVMETTKTDMVVAPPGEFPEGPTEWDDDDKHDDEGHNPFQGV